MAIEAERLRQLEMLFQAALDLPADARAAYLAAACGPDAALRDEVGSLLAHHETGGSVLDGVAAQRYADLLTGQSRRAGQSIGPYRVLRLLGAGGMGEVWLAEDTRLGRPVALKLLPAQRTGNSDGARGLTGEARAASALNHPNILTIYDIGEHAGAPFLASEYVEGVSLRQKLQQGPLALAEVIEIVCQVADGLAAAHDAGIIHCDIKPENIMVRPDGRVKVLDFGIAKRLAREQLSGVADQTATPHGMLLGTASYLSPEQARGLPVDARTDVWSLGVVLYEMVAGERPFRGETFAALSAAILEREPPPLTAARQGVSPVLQRIVAKALSKEPQTRYQTARELSHVLRRFGQHATAAAWRYRAVPIAFGVGAMALLSALFVVLWRGHSLPHRPAPPFVVGRIVKLTADAIVKDAAISPLGDWVAYVVEVSGQQALRLRQVGTPADQQRIAPAKVHYSGITFSPDGKYLYYVVSENGKLGELFRAALLEGAPRKLIEDVDSPPALSPDGRQLAFLRDSRAEGGKNTLLLASADGSGELLPLATRWSPNLFIAGPAWSPQGDVLACAASRVLPDGSLSTELVGVQRRTGREVLLTRDPVGSVTQLAWLGSGSGLVFSASDRESAVSQLFQVSYPGGVVERITRDLGDYTSVGIAKQAPALVTVQESRLSSLWVVPEAGRGRPQRLTSAASGYYQVSWTPTGSLITQSSMGGRTDLWTLQPNNGERKPLTEDDAVEWNATASPDGRYIVYSSNRSGASHIWRMEADGSRPVPLTTGAGMDQTPEVTPDSQWVVFTSWRGGHVGLWKVPLQGGSPQPLLAGLAQYPAISPDGRLIACEYHDGQPDSAWTVAVFARESGQLVHRFRGIPTDSHVVRWSPDGRSLTYIATHDGVSNLWRQPLAEQPATQITQFHEGKIFYFAWSGDGQRLACMRGTPASDAVLISGRK